MRLKFLGMRWSDTFDFVNMCHCSWSGILAFVGGLQHEKVQILRLILPDRKFPRAATHNPAVEALRQMSRSVGRIGLQLEEDFSERTGFWIDFIFLLDLLGLI